MGKTNLDKAIEKTRDKESGVSVLAKGDDGATALATLASEGVQLERANMDLLVELMRSGQYEAGQQILMLEEGTMIRGQLLGRGEPATVEDPVTKQTKQLGTWRMRLSGTGARVTFLSASQLERMLPEFVGRQGETVIVRGATTKHKGSKQLTEYFVLGPKPDAPRLPDGAQ